MFNQTFMLGLFTGLSKAANTYITIALVCLIITLIMGLMIKFEGFRIFSLIFLFLSLCLTAVFSGIHIHSYYNTKGGIVGGLTQILKPNKVDIGKTDSDITFDFKRVMLEEFNETTYRAEFITKDKIELEELKGYAVYVNGSPCSMIEYSSDLSSGEISNDYIIANFDYAFYDEYKEFILTDTLTFRFAFYKAETRLIVETQGSFDAVKLWNSYFQKNDFFVTIKQTENIYVNAYVDLEILANGEVKECFSLKKGSVYILPETLEVDGYRFMGWSLDGTTKLTESKLTILSDTKLYAILEKINNVNYCYSIDAEDNNSNIFETKGYIAGEVLSVNAPTENPVKNNYEFLGWSLDGETVIDLSEVEMSAEIKNVYAVWKANTVSVTVSLNGGNMELNGSSYIRTCKLDVTETEKIILSEPYQPYKPSYIFCYWTVTNPSLPEYSFNVSDAKFNLSISEIYRLLYGADLDNVNIEKDFSITELNIKVTWYNTADDISYWTDDDLKMAVENNLGINIGNYTSVENETWIKDVLYYNLLGMSPENMTLLEVEQEIAEILSITDEITEETTTRQFIEILYLKTIEE